MKTEKSSHRKESLLNENMVEEKLINKGYNQMFWFRKQQKIYELKLETLNN